MALPGSENAPLARIRGAMGGSDDLFSERGRSRREHLRQLLRRDDPVGLEIGFGHGHFLVGLAEAAPRLTVVGVEYQGTWVSRVAKRIARRGLDNAYVLKGDARVLLTLDVPPARLDHVFILFPDPWWKARHHRRRRMFTPELLDVLARALRPGGTLLLRTDVPSYLESSSQFVAAHPAFDGPGSTDDSDQPWAGVTTRREKKCADEGVPTDQRLWRRRASTGPSRP